MMPRNAYDIEKARRQYMQEGIERETLARSAREAQPKAGRVSRIISAFHPIMLQRIRSTQQPSPLMKPVRRAANG